MSVLNENQKMGASGAGGEFEIEQSLRFDDGRTTYLSRTPSVAGNRKTWTYSLWFKRGNLGGGEVNLFKCYTASNDNSTFQVNFNGSDQLNIGAQTVSYGTPTQVFRDTSAWYHLVIAVDTTQGTANNRVKVYVNGQQVTSFSSKSNPSQNADLAINQAAEHVIGSSRTYSNMFDGYMGEVNFIDGQALTPDSLGETGKYGEWNPIEYAGTYGTNGFYLPFKQDYTVEGFSTVVFEATQANQYIGGTGFQPDFIWFKNRTRSSPHRLVDAVRGIPKTLSSNTTGAEATGLSDGTVNRLVTGLTADGFTLGMDDGGYRINSVSGDDIVAWTWDMGGTTASNTSGTINSSVRANQAYGQSIVTYTGTGSNATVGHGLASSPQVVILKNREDGSKNWNSQFTVLGNNYIDLNRTNASYTGATYFQNTAPSSTVFSVGTAGSSNASSNDFVAYCFHDVANYSKFGSYSGNGSTTGPTVALGFSPAFLMVKCSSSTEPWTIVDSTRNPTNPRRSTLAASSSAAKVDMSAGTGIDFTSTGFQVKTNIGNYNASGQTYIYMAFADTREYAYWLDQSGNNNDWTSEGGLTESDVMVDSPTNNFATFNPLIKGGADALTEGNLKSVGTSSGKSYRPSTIGVNSGKFYFEGVITIGTAGAIGVCIEGGSLADSMGKDDFSWAYHTGGTVRHNNSNASYGASYTTNDIIGAAVDIDNGTIVFFKNGASQGSYSIVGFSPDTYFLGAGDSTTGSSTGWVLNFGSDSSFAGSKTQQGNSDANGIGDFYYQPPSGFLSLCTKSLPSVDVIPSEHFNPVIYTGNGTSSSSSQAINTVGFQPDFTWIKIRAGQADSHSLTDSVRGVSKHLRSDTTNAEVADQHLTSFDTNGFTLRGSGGQSNNNNFTYVAWNWKAGGSASSNSNGTITSQVSANVDAGFSIVTYTGTGSNATVGHGLSQKPSMSLIKPRNFADNWIVTYDAVDGSDDQAYLNLTNAGASPAAQYAVAQNATTLGLTGWNNVNDANDTYVAYCFHSVESYSKVGSYVGNGNVDGPMVNLGFKPKFMMVKRITEVGVWFMFDTERSPHNVMNTKLNANSSDAEDSDTSWNIDFLSNGFKLRGNHVYINSQNNSHIFIAFAENPFKHSNAR